MTTYKDAGVDVQATDALVNDISSLSKSTKRKGSIDSIGGFGGIFDLKECGYKDPLLISGTDGIGTKILLPKKLSTAFALAICDLKKVKNIFLAGFEGYKNNQKKRDEMNKIFINFNNKKKFVKKIKPLTKTLYQLT